MLLPYMLFIIFRCENTENNFEKKRAPALTTKFISEFSEPCRC